MNSAHLLGMMKNNNPVEADLLYHQPFTDLTSLSSPLVGYGFDTNTDPIFVATNSGFGLDCNSQAYSLFSDQTKFRSMLVDSEGTIEYIARYTDISVTDGISSSSALNCCFDIYDASATQRMFHANRSTDSGLRFYFVDSTGTALDARLTNVTVALNGYIKWRIVFKTTGPLGTDAGIDGSSDTIRIYANEVLKYSTTAILNFKFATQDNLDWRWGTTVANPDSNYFRGVLDDAKTFNYAKVY